MSTTTDLRGPGDPCAGEAGPPAPSLAGARAALTSARRYRAERLLAVAGGELSALAVIAQAATAQGAPLRRISLRQLLLAVPHCGQQSTTRVLHDMAGVLTVDAAGLGGCTVGWLVDPRSGGRRMLAWLDAHQRPRPEPPWPGFPYAPVRGRP